MCQVVAVHNRVKNGVYTGDFLGYMWYNGIYIYKYYIYMDIIRIPQNFNRKWWQILGFEVPPFQTNPFGSVYVLSFKTWYFWSGLRVGFKHVETTNHIYIYIYDITTLYCRSSTLPILRETLGNSRWRTKWWWSSGMILTGNQSYFPIKIMGLKPVNFPLNQPIDNY